jgi:Arc/MetJ-type ribon-helix-helix transcriptional regulator
MCGRQVHGEVDESSVGRIFVTASEEPATHGILYPEERNGMPTKVNVVLDDDVKADLDRLVESGKRSRVINNALRREILLISRRAANARLDEIRTTTKSVSTAEIVKLIRRDRGR